MSEQSTTNGLVEIVRDNLTLIVAAGLAYAAAVEFGYASYPEAPDGTGLLAAAGVVVGAVGWFAAGKIYDLLPEEHGIYLRVINKNDEVYETHELSEDFWEDLQVIDPPLKHHDDALHRCYECYAYDDEKGVAVSTWSNSLSGSDVVGHQNAEAAQETLTEIRNDLEKEGRYARVLRRQIPSIIRRLDRRRAMEQNAALDEHMTPSFEDGQTIDELLSDELPNEVLPDRMMQDDSENLGSEPDNDASIALRLLDDLSGEDDPEPVQNGHKDAIEGEQ